MEHRQPGPPLKASLVLSVRESLLWFVFVSLAIYCAMMGTSQSAGFSVFMSFRKGGAGAASGIFGVLNFLFGALCSPLVGLLGEKSMLPLGLNLFVCAILATLLLLVALKLKKS